MFVQNLYIFGEFEVDADIFQSSPTLLSMGKSCQEIMSG